MMNVMGHTWHNFNRVPNRSKRKRIIIKFEKRHDMSAGASVWECNGFLCSISMTYDGAVWLRQW